MTDLEGAADSPRVSVSLGAVTELTLQRPKCANALDGQTSVEFWRATCASAVPTRASARTSLGSACARAAELGLLTRAAAPRALELEATRSIDELAEGAPLALRQTVATQRAALLSHLEEALPRETMCQANGFASADLREAVLAFRQRRKPVFGGR